MEVLDSRSKSGCGTSSCVKFDSFHYSAFHDIDGFVMIPRTFFFDYYTKKLALELSFVFTSSRDFILKRVSEYLSKYIGVFLFTFITFSVLITPEEAFIQLSKIYEFFGLDEELFLLAFIIFTRYYKFAGIFNLFSRLLFVLVLGHILKIKQNSEVFYLLVLCIFISCKSLMDVPVNSGMIAERLKLDTSRIYYNELQIFIALNFSVFYDLVDIDDKLEKIFPLEGLLLLSYSKSLNLTGLKIAPHQIDDSHIFDSSLINSSNILSPLLLTSPKLPPSHQISFHKNTISNNKIHSSFIPSIFIEYAKMSNYSLSPKSFVNIYPCLPNLYVPSDMSNVDYKPNVCENIYSSATSSSSGLFSNIPLSNGFPCPVNPSVYKQSNKIITNTPNMLSPDQPYLTGNCTNGSVEDCLHPQCGNYCGMNYNGNNNINFRFQNGESESRNEGFLGCSSQNFTQVVPPYTQSFPSSQLLSHHDSLFTPHKNLQSFYNVYPPPPPSVLSLPLAPSTSSLIHPPLSQSLPPPLPPPLSLPLPPPLSQPLPRPLSLPLPSPLSPSLPPPSNYRYKSQDTYMEYNQKHQQSLINICLQYPTFDMGKIPLQQKQPYQMKFPLNGVNSNNFVLNNDNGFVHINNGYIYNQMHCHTREDLLNNVNF
jgi:hypothetical protein